MVKKKTIYDGKRIVGNVVSEAVRAGKINNLSRITIKIGNHHTVKYVNCNTHKLCLWQPKMLSKKDMQAKILESRIHNIGGV
jgi:hypothetical protein